MILLLFIETLRIIIIIILVLLILILVKSIIKLPILRSLLELIT